MFSSIGFSEVLVLGLIGLMLFGPNRLPALAKDAGRMLRQLRKMANEAAKDIKSEMGPEMADVSLRSMHPRRLVQDMMMADDTPAPTRAPAGQVPTQVPTADRAAE